MPTPAEILRNKRKYSKDQVKQAAKDLGQQGGLIGGPARAEALSSEQRINIARHAANCRWGVGGVYKK